jgi:acetyl-CoA synthetase
MACGLMDILMPGWFHGLPVLTYRSSAFDAEQALQMMGKHRVRATLLTPTMLKLIRQVTESRSVASPSICVSWSADRKR